jgi:hypothetical protein
MKIDGRCHCGFITYEADVDPRTVSVCHCTDCQQLSGSPFRTSIAAHRKVFRMRTGQPKIYVKTAASGAKRAQAFCPECGSPIYSAAFEHPDVYMIRTGTIRQRNELRPQRQIWCGSALSWLGEIASTPATSEQRTD